MKTATSDGAAGMAWWNALSEKQRAEWLSRANSARPADAWAAYKREAPLLLQQKLVLAQMAIEGLQRRLNQSAAEIERVAGELGLRGLIDLSDDLRLEAKGLRDAAA